MLTLLSLLGQGTAFPTQRCACAGVGISAGASPRGLGCRGRLHPCILGFQVLPTESLHVLSSWALISGTFGTHVHAHWGHQQPHQGLIAVAKMDLLKAALVSEKPSVREKWFLSDCGGDDVDVFLQILCP